MIKIPTLVGMGILLIGLIAGVYLATQNQIIKSRAAITTAPKNIHVVNISANSASIYWQTDGISPGFVKAGTSTAEQSTYRDDRDLSSPEPHKFHFVTMTNLSPATTYHYQIYSGSSVYPDTPATFKTPSQQPSLDWLPLVGTVFDVDNQPVKESFITLEINGAQKLAAITKTNGNFILPLSNLRTADLTKTFPAGNNPFPSILKITGPAKNTEVAITLPTESSALPPIFLGKNMGLVASPSANITEFDLNGDGVVNTADLSIIFKNFGPVADTGSTTPKTDLNGDGVVDQKDVDLLLPYLK